MPLRDMWLMEHGSCHLTQFHSKGQLETQTFF